MKTPRKGPIVLIIFLVLIPVAIDLILLAVLPQNGTPAFSMIGLLSMGYIRSIPSYIAYLIIAFTILFFIKKWRKEQSSKDE